MFVLMGMYYVLLVVVSSPTAVTASRHRLGRAILGLSIAYG
jgi:hypothetical protein